MRIPILMYHSISDDPETGHPYYWINTSPALFAQHMQYLHDNGYQVISLSTAVEMIKNQTYYLTPASLQDASLSLSPEVLSKHSVCREAAADSDLPTSPGKSENSNTSASFSSVTSADSSERTSPANGREITSSRFVVLTFDDGYADFYTQAFPVLQRYGFTATVFLPTDYIGNGRPGLRGKQHLTWEQVRELAAQGITFGSHTCTHPQLAELSLQDAEQELRRSKQVFEEQGTGCAGTFCYPFRFPEQNAGFMEGFNETLQRVGYEACASTRVGTINTAEDMLALKRIPVNSGDDVALFEAKLRGAYDWLAGVQSAAKRLRSRPSKSQSLLHAEPVTRNP